jgi:hypothetical protein
LFYWLKDELSQSELLNVKKIIDSKPKYMPGISGLTQLENFRVIERIRRDLPNLKGSQRIQVERFINDLENTYYQY